MNYESELNEILLDELSKMYNIYDSSILYQYFYLRFLISNNSVRIDKWNRYGLIVEFLLNELNLPLTSENISYKGVTFNKRWSSENSIENIVTEWDFRASLYNVINSKGKSISFEEYIKKEHNKVIRYGRNKAKIYKGTAHYQLYLKKNALELLNKQYGAKIKNPNLIININYPETHNIFSRTIDEIYLIETHSIELITYTTNTITESDVEKYLKKNLAIIEEGLEYVDSQYTIKDGRIDILAKDINNKYVIVELKIEEDKSIFWQALYYPMQFAKEHHLDYVRMIIVSSALPEHILTPLKLIKGIEIVKFVPHVELGKIKNIKIQKIK